MAKRKKTGRKLPLKVYKEAIDSLFMGQDFGASWAVQKGKFYALPDAGGSEPLKTKLGQLLREATIRAMDAALVKYGLKADDYSE